MAGKVEDFNFPGAYIIVPADFEPQRELAGQAFAIMLEAASYTIKDTGGFGDNAMISARNPAGAAITFFLNAANKEIQMRYARPFKRWVADNDQNLAEAVLDLAKETSRAKLILDRAARQVDIFAEIDLGNFEADEIIMLIEKRWQEMARLCRNTGLAAFVMPLGMANAFAAKQLLAA